MVILLLISVMVGCCEVFIMQLNVSSTKRGKTIEKSGHNLIPDSYLQTEINTITHF